MIIFAKGKRSPWGFSGLVIFIYIIVTIVVAGSALFHGYWAAAFYTLATCLVFLAAGGGLKAIVLAKEKGLILIGGIIISLLLCGLGQWLSSGFSVGLFGHTLSGAVWGWIGFAVCILFTSKQIAGVK